MAAIDHDAPTLDMREKLAHIDLMLAQHDRVRQEIRYAPGVLIISSMAAGAGLLGAAILLLKLVIVGS